MSNNRLFPRAAITRAQVEAVHALSPRRRRFSDHRAYKESDEKDDIIAFPFKESLQYIFESETGLRMYDHGFGPCLFLKNDEDRQSAKNWERRRENYIFLRDCLDLSLSIDLNLLEAGEYTDIGRAEHEAKADESRKAIQFLAENAARVISDIPILATADMIVPAPCDKSKRFDLPREIVSSLPEYGIVQTRIDALHYTNKAKSLKETPFDEKWQALDESGLVIEGDFAGKSVLIIDDKYQSGTTMQFAASKIVEAGAFSVYGLTCVKTWRDSDNS